MTTKKKTPPPAVPSESDVESQPPAALAVVAVVAEGADAQPPDFVHVPSHHDERPPDAELGTHHGWPGQGWPLGGDPVPQGVAQRTMIPVTDLADVRARGDRGGN